MKRNLMTMSSLTSLKTILLVVGKAVFLMRMYTKRPVSRNDNNYKRNVEKRPSYDSKA